MFELAKILPIVLCAFVPYYISTVEYSLRDVPSKLEAEDRPRAKLARALALPARRDIH